MLSISSKVSYRTFGQLAEDLIKQQMGDIRETFKNFILNKDIPSHVTIGEEKR